MIWKNIFRRRFRPWLLDNKYRIVPAFTVKGVDYFMFDSTMEVPSGRQMAALFIYGEMQMRCSREYLEKHCQAMDKVLSDPKKIDLTTIMKLNMNLKERLELAVLPEFIYKLASIIFFDKTESPISYDIEYNQKKIKSWKESGATLDFFLNTPLASLIPSLSEQGVSSPAFLNLAEKISQIHLDSLTDVLSRKA